jgi:hypothetical protein
MSLINPWLLLGLAAVAVPVLVHLVQREERRGSKFPSLMFVRRIPFEVKRRRRLRDRALLALRCLALAAIVFAFAAPMLDREAAAGLASEHERDVVILLDRSYSMSHPQRWERAVAAAGQRIDALASNARAALVVFDDRARIVAELTRDKSLLRESLERTNPGTGRTGYAAAFVAANRLLVRSEAKQRHVVLISDLQRSALDDSAAFPLNENVSLEIVPVTGAVGPNATVIDARLAPDRDDGVEDALVVRVQNTGDEILDGAHLQMNVNGQAVDTRPLTLAAGEVGAWTLPLVPAADRPTRITLEVGPDALPADDRYHLVLAPRRPVNVALIEPEGFRAHHGVFFEEALRLARAPAIRVTRVGVHEIDGTRLDGFDVLLLDDVPVRSGPVTDAMAAFVTRGGGLFAAAGPSTGAAWPGGNGGFLPAMPARQSPEPTAGRRVDVVAADHPLWTAAGLDRSSPFSAATVGQVRRLVPAPVDRVLARLEPDLPLLMERTIGAGRVLVLATTTDPGWGTLALDPGFVPFAQAAVRYLAGRSGWTSAFTAGDVVDLARLSGHLADGAGWRDWLANGGGIVVETPTGGAQRIRRAGSALFAAAQAGMYEAHRGDGAGDPLPFAVNVARGESRFAAASPDEFERRIVRRGRAAIMPANVATGAAEADPFGIARWLLLFAGLALITESLLAKRISRRGVSAAPGGPA